MGGESGVSVIVGLGNPGDEYASTRHNIGFDFVDELAAEFGGVFRRESKFHGECCRISISGQQCWLLKPLTFMNRSGQSVSAFMKFYRIPLEQVLVVHDELDLPPGDVRLKRGGGHGGHNGLRDIIAACSGKDFLRLRLGVGHPGDRNQVVNYVLGRAGKAERELMGQAMVEAVREAADIVDGRYQQVMNRLHSK